jgi:hypothetical protein
MRVIPFLSVIQQNAFSKHDRYMIDSNYGREDDPMDGFFSDDERSGSSLQGNPLLRTGTVSFMAIHAFYLKAEELREPFEICIATGLCSEPDRVLAKPKLQVGAEIGIALL